MIKIEDLKQVLKLKAKENKQFFGALKKKSDQDLDLLFHSTHEEVFEKTDCSTCANCCKTTSPIFYQKDIERASKAIKVKPGIFIESYLLMDEDGDFVLKSTPCVFLNTHNYCSIYENRPAACREYPHTNRKKVKQLLELTQKNLEICPAVYEIIEKIKVKLQN